MPKMRVFQDSDGTIRVMRLNERHRRPGETEETSMAKVRVFFALALLLCVLVLPAGAATVRACSEASGNVRILKPNPRFVTGMDAAALSRFLDGEQVKDASMVGLSCLDVDDATLPASRAQRHKWRLLGGAVIVNPSIPDPPKPNQALIDEANAATTVNQLRAVLLKVLQGH